MAIKIDWDFIQSLEGASVLTGYVPKNKKGEVIGKSGVTIASGFDIGQQTPQSLLNLLAPFNDIAVKLLRYTELKGKVAVAYLKEFPLYISHHEADIIDNHMQHKTLNNLIRHWNMACTKRFDALPPRAQTILFSLAWNFGANLPLALPNTFKAAVEAAENSKWINFKQVLENFPSKNPELKSRRAKEAAYILP